MRSGFDLRRWHVRLLWLPGRLGGFSPGTQVLPTVKTIETHPHFVVTCISIHCKMNKVSTWYVGRNANSVVRSKVYCWFHLVAFYLGNVDASCPILRQTYARHILQWPYSVIHKHPGVHHLVCSAVALINPHNCARVCVSFLPPFLM